MRELGEIAVGSAITARNRGGPRRNREDAEAKEPFDENLSRAEASKRIDELQSKTGRGR